MVCDSVSFPRHIVIFPFLAKGHMIPLLQLARCLHQRRLATTTIITTPLNSPFICAYLLDTNPTIIEIPFPRNVPGLPPGVESTDQLPSMMSFFGHFLAATKLLQPHFEEAMSNLTNVSFLISDIFYGWSTGSCSKLNIPRVIFYSWGNFATTVTTIVSRHRPHASVSSSDEPFPIPGFPDLHITIDDLNPPFDHHQNLILPHKDFVDEQIKPTLTCEGVIVNSFYEFEAPYVDYFSENFGPKAWCIGPLCLALKAELPPTELMNWLDSRLALNRPVLYVAFGSQSDVSDEQIDEIAKGLERSGLDFLWVVRATQRYELGFEERVKERGKLLTEWVGQLDILRHESVRGFVSHCGWNSVMESICARVPIMAWPLEAEQHLNAKFVVEEYGIGLRIRAADGTKKGLVMAEDIAKLAKELVVGEGGRIATEKIKRLGVVAEKAMMDGGSSASSLEQMIDEVTKNKGDRI